MTELTPFHQSRKTTLYQGDAATVIRSLPPDSVDCVVTSPPYYGQRDFGHHDQIGLEETPFDYLDRLLAVFAALKPVLKPTGSVWINLGDTYWSGKGAPGGPDSKNKNRRFARPQYRSGPKPLCVPKQQLLIPHRFAIAMQDDGWICRNDIVWHKADPTPDPVRDRSSTAHEYLFHFVQRRKYFYDAKAATLGPSRRPPVSVWFLGTAGREASKCPAPFPAALVRIPVLATLPSGGTILDPFVGSGTSLAFALQNVTDVKAIGIDLDTCVLQEARKRTLIAEGSFLAKCG